jgi:3-phenylpropionate/trans-cinnamate dioxygenase ferredoxin reductase subunit
VSQIGSVVIVGGGLAGASAAFALREQGFGGRLVIVGEESHLPYERPPLSKGYLRAEDTADKMRVRPGADYDRAGIELLHARGVALDAGRRELRLDDGARLGYDRLLLATGSSSRRLRMPNAELDGIHYLRTQDDADALQTAAATATSIAIVGGGWIGSEVAASLRQLGHAVTMVMNIAAPLEHVLGLEVASVYADLHQANGVTLITGMVEAIEGDGRVSGLLLEDGRRIPADLVVVGVGAVPRTELATLADLAMANGGVAVDQYLRSSDEHIYAAGDIAAAWHPRLNRRVRVEHWDNAAEQGRAAAVNLLGGSTPYERTPYFYSDQFDLGMEYRGAPTAWDQVILRGDVAAREFLAFWLQRGHVVAAMNANIWDAGDALADLVDREASVDPDRLGDLAHPLEDVAA